MEPDVPFALLGVVQFLAVAAWLGLAASSVGPRLRRRGTPVFVVGALLLAAADGVTAVRFGEVDSTALAVVRTAGLLLVALGLWGRSLQRFQLPVAGVVVPLGAAPTPSAVAAGSAVLAALAAVRGGRHGDRWVAALLCGAFLAVGASVALGPWARTSTTAALAVLAVRALAAAAAFAAAGMVARASVLAKVVGAILVGVVAMAAAAVGVVGTGVADQVQQQQDRQLAQVADGQQQAAGSLATQAAAFAHVVAACPSDANQCRRLLDILGSRDYVAARVGRDGGVQGYVPGQQGVLPALAGEPAVRQVLTGGTPSGSAASLSTVTVLPVHGPTVVALGVAPGYASPQQAATPGAHPSFAAVYGFLLDDSYAATVHAQTSYDLSFVVDGRLLGTSVAGVEADRLQRVISRAGQVSGGRTIDARGELPTASLRPLTAGNNDEVRVATLVVSQPAGQALAAQREVLTRVFLTAVAVLLVVSLLAFLLGGRVVEPVRRLTAAAGRVRRGDLDVTTGVSGPDEVGALARAFDAMTGALRRMTGDLRAAADEEAALRARLETVLQSMSDALVATDADGVVTSANPAAVALLGVEADDLVGRRLGEATDVRTTDDAPLLATGVEREGVARRPDGAELPVRVSAAPLTGAGEVGQGFVVLLRDTTREREVERMKTEFLSNVSHELRTPLTPIKGYAEIMRRRPDLDPATVTHYVDTIIESTDRMGRVVELLVDVATLEAGRVVAVRRPVAVGAYVDDLLEQWRRRWPTRAADFRRRVATRLPAVDADPNWLGKALTELADNAVKYTPAGTPITLFAASVDGTVRLGLRDAGPGVSTEQLPQLLSDFAQADASETRRVGGMGLGLSFVRRLAEALGVRFVVSSDLGQGAEFALDVPTAAAPPQPRPRRGSAARVRGNSARSR